MAKPTIRKVAVVGAGVIGRSCIQVFARAGCEVGVFDPSPEQLSHAMDWFNRDVKHLRETGAITSAESEARWARASACESVEEALDGAGYLQENAPERLEDKRVIFAELDRLAGPQTILASSTSTLDATEIAKGLAGAARCIVAHPINPPHVVPVVEILGSAATTAAVVQAASDFMKSVGQVPLLVKRYVRGFVINRLQIALIREAVDLLSRGVADVEAIDSGLRDGIGLRWAFLGPFGTANTNADGGVREYFARYGDALRYVWDDLNTDVELTDELVGLAARQTDALHGTDRLALRSWRDRMVVAIRALKEAEAYV